MLESTCIFETFLVSLQVYFVQNLPQQTYNSYSLHWSITTTLLHVLPHPFWAESPREVPILIPDIYSFKSEANLNYFTVFEIGQKCLRQILLFTTSLLDFEPTKKKFKRRINENLHCVQIQTYRKSCTKITTHLAKKRTIQPRQTAPASCRNSYWKDQFINRPIPQVTRHYNNAKYIPCHDM